MARVKRGTTVRAKHNKILKLAKGYRGRNSKVYTVAKQKVEALKIKKFEELITPRTKGILICNPNNPTGALYPKEILEQIVAIAREHQLMIFSDEIYDRLVLEGEEIFGIGSASTSRSCRTQRPQELYLRRGSCRA